MRRVTLASRRLQRYFRRPPPPRWLPTSVRSLGTVAAIATVLAAGTWALATDLPGRFADGVVERWYALTASAGLVVGEVFVEGRSRTSADQLRAQLAVEIGAPILALDPAAAKARLESLDWVQQATVARLLPGVVRIRLLERQPLALWQHDGRHVVIDRTGKVIEQAVDATTPLSDYRHLRVVVGDGAPSRAAQLFALLSTEPRLSDRVVAASWVGGRRWTLHLDNQMEVLLPEARPTDAWRLLAAKARDHRLLDRAITAIDLRFVPDRIHLRLDPSVFQDDAGGQGA